MAVSLNYVTLAEFADVMTEEEQAEATDDEYGAGGTIDGTGATRDDEMVERFLFRAENMVDSYLMYYDRPIDPVPPTVSYTVMIIARYMIDERGDGAVSETIQESYDRAMDWLEAVRDGELDLGANVEEQTEEYFGARTGGLFEEGTFNDKSSAFTTNAL